MDWANTTIARILLIIARMLAKSDELRKELEQLNAHLSYNQKRGSE